MEPHPVQVTYAQDLLSGQDERRAHPRLRCGGVADIRVLPMEAKASGNLLDLSVTGCCIETSASLPTLENSVIEVHLRMKGFTLRITAVVRHVGSDHHLGIEFLDVTERKAAQIEEIMAELQLMERQYLENALEMADNNAPDAG